MSKLSVDQKTISDLFSDKKADFLIPDYQRPYAWGIEECDTLWADLFTFAFPEKNKDLFNPSTEEFYLGPIVTFSNSNKKQEIIDGQQRLTTIMLLLRAFYEKFCSAQDKESRSTRQNIEQCIWKTNEFKEPDKDQLKIDSEVASDYDKREFLSILRTGNTSPSNKSGYAKNFNFFKRKVDELVNTYPSYTSLFAMRILNNVILLPIEADSLDTALRIFMTLNDRGLPLSDADIFKSQFYKFYQTLNKKDEFIEQWKDLEEKTKEIFKSSDRPSSHLDELFTRYMYYERALKGIVDSTTSGLRKFFSEDNYALLKKEETFRNLQALAEFWRLVSVQDNSFSERVLRQLFILNYAPNRMWTYLVSVYFLSRRKEDSSLDERDFYTFLKKTAAFILAYPFIHPGVNALRDPVYKEMRKIVQRQDVSLTFNEFKISRNELKPQLESFTFSNQRPITRSILVWWDFFSSEQPLIDISIPLQIEHIYAKNRNKKEPLTEPSLIESLGNKAMLEARINIRATDYRFSDKKAYYLGKSGSFRLEKPSEIKELLSLANTFEDFTESDIKARKEKIIKSLLDYLDENNLLDE